MAEGEQTSSAARSTAQGPTFNVLNQAYETRELIVAQGIDFTNADMRRRAAGASGRAREYLEYCCIPHGLQQDFPQMVISGDEAEYVSDVQRVRFTIRVVTTKDAFKRALETPGVHVIYAGHARYGRGPCFGSSGDPGDDWEQGVDPNTGGLWRFGYPYIGVHLAEIREHGYRFYPVAADGNPPPRSDRHPDVPSRLRRIQLPEDLRSKVLPQGQPLAEEYWGYTDREGAAILLHAGWQNTISAPMDLGATTLNCRCFCHFGCSTFRHNWRILRHRCGWRRTETDHFAYFTTAPSTGIGVPCWITALFQYPRRNDYESWYPSLQWARERASNLIRVKMRYFGYPNATWRII